MSGNHRPTEEGKAWWLDPTSRERGVIDTISSTRLTFSTSHFWEWYDHLRMKQFSQFRIVDWKAISLLELEEEVREMFQSGEWGQLFSIEEKTYRDTTLEVLSMIEENWKLVDFDTADSVRFQLFGEQRAQSYTEFSHLLVYMTLILPLPRSMSDYWLITHVVRW